MQGILGQLGECVPRPAAVRVPLNASIQFLVLLEITQHERSFLLPFTLSDPEQGEGLYRRVER